MIQNNNDNYVLIMAGGVGSRFWPQSRNSFPKQFIDILGVGKSLLQLTYERFLKVCPAENIFILSNESYREIVLSQLEGIPGENILLEPSRNNTAPCIAYGCYKILKANPAANIVVAPSDHLILKEDIFLEKIHQALQFTRSQDAILTLGINPTRPDTGYGYINFDQQGNEGVYRVNCFLEKPVLAKAQEYFSSGDYLWNSGIFIWRASVIRDAFEKYAPEIHKLFLSGNEAYNTELETAFIHAHYHESTNISIDYAILEKAENVYTIPADIGWSDLGTWASLYEISDKDVNDNALSRSRLHLAETNKCIIQLPKGKAAVIKGLNNFIVVDDGKVLLIYPKEDEQEIKQVAARMVNDFGNDYL